MNRSVVRVGEADLAVEIDDYLKLRVDAHGRWLSLRDETGLYRRALDGRVVKCARPPSDVGDADAVHERVREVAALISGRLSAPGRESEQGRRAVAREWLQRVQDWDAARFSELAAEFHVAYPEPVPILPPDRMLDIVVLPALGCPWAKCTFCAFYQDRSYRVVGEQDFARHVLAVKQLFGRTEILRHGLFLGSANALGLSDRRLLGVLAEVRAQFGERPRGVGAFWDPDHSPDRNVAAWQTLARAGLRIVYAGLESGDSDLRRRFGKHADVDAFVERVRLARSAGIRIGITLLAGISGDAALSAAHHQATTRTVAAMQLGADDIVFVSPLKSSEPASARRDARDLITKLARDTAARVAPYAMELFRYYA